MMDLSSKKLESSHHHKTEMIIKVILQRAAKLALQVLYVTAYPFVRLSVRPSHSGIVSK